MDDDIRPLIRIQAAIAKARRAATYIADREQRETLLFWADVLEKQTRERDQLR